MSLPWFWILRLHVENVWCNHVWVFALDVICTVVALFVDFFFSFLGSEMFNCAWKCSGQNMNYTTYMFNVFHATLVACSLSFSLSHTHTLICTHTLTQHAGAHVHTQWQTLTPVLNSYLKLCTNIMFVFHGRKLILKQQLNFQQYGVIICVTEFCSAYIVCLFVCVLSQCDGDAICTCVPLHPL